MLNGASDFKLRIGEIQPFEDIRAHLEAGKPTEELSTELKERLPRYYEFQKHLKNLSVVKFEGNKPLPMMPQFPIARSNPIAKIPPTHDKNTAEERQKVNDNYQVLMQKRHEAEAKRRAQDSQRKTYQVGRLGHEAEDLPEAVKKNDNQEYPVIKLSKP